MSNFGFILNYISSSLSNIFRHAVVPLLLPHDGRWGQQDSYLNAFLSAHRNQIFRIIVLLLQGFYPHISMQTLLILGNFLTIVVEMYVDIENESSTESYFRRVLLYIFRHVVVPIIFPDDELFRQSSYLYAYVIEHRSEIIQFLTEL